MDWRDLLEEPDSYRSLPWFGFRRVHTPTRTWTIQGDLPPEHGWYTFRTDGGRYCTFVQPSALDPEYALGNAMKRGYLVGNRFIPNSVRIVPDPAKLVEQTEQVYCVEAGLGRFARVAVVADQAGYNVYIAQEFPEGPELKVTEAYQDRAESVRNIPGVTPPLDLAFRWATHQRGEKERRQREIEELRQKEERRRRAIRDAGTAAGRRVLAAQDFELAAREALRFSGAELLDVRDSCRQGEKVVQYRFNYRRLECVVDALTLRVVDAGVCLTDHLGTKGDTLFTLESLPGVINEAMRQNKLVVWRHLEM